MSAEVIPPTRGRKLSLYRRIRNRIVRQPASVRYSFLAVLVLGLSLGSYYFFHVRARTRVLQEVEAQWRRFDLAVNDLDESELLAAVDEVLRLKSDEPLAITRKRALETGEAEPTDDLMLRLTSIRLHLAQRLPDAEREASKLLARNPNHWYCRCILAHAALARNDREGAVRQLDSLPKPDQASPRLSPYDLILAFDLFRMADRDSEALHNYLRNEVIGNVGIAGNLRAPLPAKIQLLKMYLIAFEMPNESVLSDKLSEAWAGVSKLSAVATEDANSSTDTAVLIRLGHAFNQLHSSLVQLRLANLITDEQFQSNREAHETRTRAVWERTIQLVPNDPDACHGLAAVCLRSKDADKAREYAERGTATDPNHIELIRLLCMIDLREGKTGSAAARSGLAAERKKTDVGLWLLYADMADLANARDIAIAACKNARTLSPNNTAIAYRKARLHIDDGDPHAAAQELTTIPTAQLLQDPRASRYYAYSLMSANLGSEAFRLLKAAEPTVNTSGTPTILAETIRGITDIRYEPKKHDKAVFGLAESIGKTLVEKWPTDPHVLAAYAMVLYRKAESTTPPWEPMTVSSVVGMLDRARSAFDASSQRSASRVDVAARLAWLKLKVRKQTDGLSEIIRPLETAAQNGEPLDTFPVEVLGAALIATDKLKDARSLLESGSRAYPNAPGIRIQLARVYLKLKKTDEAADTLAQARNMPRTDQEDAEYQEALATLNREKP